jgi:hypothetical protein
VPEAARQPLGSSASALPVCRTQGLGTDPPPDACAGSCRLSRAYQLERKAARDPVEPPGRWRATRSAIDASVRGRDQHSGTRAPVSPLTLPAPPACGTTRSAATLPDLPEPRSPDETVRDARCQHRARRFRRRSLVVSRERCLRLLMQACVHERRGGARKGTKGTALVQPLNVPRTWDSRPGLVV